MTYEQLLLEMERGGDEGGLITYESLMADLEADHLVDARTLIQGIKLVEDQKQALSALLPTPHQGLLPTPDKGILPTPDRNILPTPDKRMLPIPDIELLPTPDKRILPIPDIGFVPDNGILDYPDILAIPSNQPMMMTGLVTKQIEPSDEDKYEQYCLEQEPFNSQLYFAGIHESPEESRMEVMDKVKEISNEVGVYIFDDDILECARYGQSRGKNGRNIAVTFKDADMKNRLYDRRKNMAQLTPPVYLNERLCAGFRAIYMQARNMKGRNQIVYTYTYNGRVFVKLLPPSGETVEVKSIKVTVKLFLLKHMHPKKG